MKNYHCTVDALDYLMIQKHQEGINFSINMFGADTSDFNSPAIVLTKDEVIRLINELTDLIK
ncbi:MAG: hypothetical protein ACOVOQ_07340 [Flavobacterium sp.]|jgi:hypothetical protein